MEWHRDIFAIPSQEYESVCADPSVKYKEKHFLATARRKVAYQGCFTDSHWGGHRKKQNWDLLVKYAPKIAKKHSEVPNSLRDVLNITTKKWNGGKFSKSDGLHVIPPSLALALDTIIMDRLAAGEEVSYDFVESTLKLLVKLWNEKIEELQADVQETVQKKILQAQNAIAESEDVGDDVARMAKDDEMTALSKLLETLQPCNISTQPTALGNLA